ncbi:MAG: hypothetical protein IKB58_00040, partial [Oscillospiraceae bacterium]|nr:hypothetical protein [Oscillospiraceae bacterium]
RHKTVQMRLYTKNTRLSTKTSYFLAFLLFSVYFGRDEKTITKSCVFQPKTDEAEGQNFSLLQVFFLLFLLFFFSFFAILILYNYQNLYCADALCERRDNI